MKTLLLLALTAVITSCGLLVLTAATTDTIPPVSASGAIPIKKTMKAFSSEQELLAYLHKVTENSLRRRAEKEMTNYALAPAGVVDAASPIKTESVTNTQHAGVDEGGI